MLGAGALTQRDDMGRGVGGEFRIGNSCTPMADSCQCLAKPIQYCKVKKKKKKSKDRNNPPAGDLLKSGFLKGVSDTFKY